MLRIVLFIDLINKYSELLPPTLAKKKRESERKVPVRRRTRPVDMRMSRSRLNPGMDPKEIQALQLLQRTGANSISSRSSTVSSQSSPFVPSIPPAVGSTPDAAPVPATATVTAEPEIHAGEMTAEPHDGTVTAEPEALHEEPAVPPPPPHEEPAIEVTPVPAPESTDDLPPRPTFKEPPPEDDDLPPRPNFKEPPPEIDDAPEPTPQILNDVQNVVEVPAPAPVATPAYAEPQAAVEVMPSPPARPTFAEPPPEPTSPIPSPPPSAIPPSLRRASATSSRSGSPIRWTPIRQDSRSPSPTKPSTGNASPTIPPPGPGTGLRGPRIVRGPRPTSTVGERVSTFNARAASPGLSGTGTNASGALGRSGSRAYGAHAKKGSVSRVAEFSRRTMASDAEDEVVEK